MAGRSKNPSSQKGMPSGKVGAYRAPVDTTGMSPEDKRIFGFDDSTKPKKTPPRPKKP